MLSLFHKAQSISQKWPPLSKITMHRHIHHCPPPTASLCLRQMVIDGRTNGYIAADSDEKKNKKKNPRLSDCRRALNHVLLLPCIKSALDHLWGASPLSHLPTVTKAKTSCRIFKNIHTSVKNLNTYLVPRYVCGEKCNRTSKKKSHTCNVNAWLTSAASKLEDS